MKHFYDLHVDSSDLSSKVSLAKRLGWSGVCLAREFDSDYKAFLLEVEKEREKSGIAILAGALIKPRNAEDLVKRARQAVETADIVLAAGGSEEVNRAASECYEVDILCTPEGTQGKDLMDQRNSGLDDAMVKFMAERGIAIEVNLSTILGTYGMARAQAIGRMKQNMVLAEKHGAPVVMASGAIDETGMRSPRDLQSLLLSFGVGESFVKKVMTEFPETIVRKSRDRRDPNVITKGLEVVSPAAGEKKGKKRMFGWY